MDFILSLFGDTLHQDAEGLNRVAPDESLARSVVQEVGKGIGGLFIMGRQVRAREQDLAQQPIGVFAGASLPSSV